MNPAGVLSYLRQQQAADGSFFGYASPQVAPFVPKRKQPTAFPTMLIMDCLNDVVGAEDIRLRAAKYIEKQVSEQGSWNYWERGSGARQKEPYPDDLDDTACAVAGLTRADPKWLSSYRLGQFTRLLVTAESKPGGPYRTWLIDAEEAPEWKTVDVAVNANINYALSLQSVQLQGLTTYIDAAIKDGNLRSDYYIGVEPVLYFMSRSYQGKQAAWLQERITACMRDGRDKNALQLALLLSAGCRMDVTRRYLTQVAHALHDKISDNAWPGEALYVDPAYDGKQHFSGSDALTTAFALEALTAYTRKFEAPTTVIARKRGTPKVMKHIQEDAKAISEPELRGRYVQAARAMLRDAAGEQISAPASLMAKAVGWRTDYRMLDRLNLGGLNGWVAYTLYDDMLDNDADLHRLPVANVAHRRSLQYFYSALPAHEAWAAYVTQVFDTIDGANHWELTHARASIKDGVLRLGRLPDYGDYMQLANRSLGHGLAATAVMVDRYGSLDHPQIQTLQAFFKSFLIARQLNDDAHDWEDDLRAGRLSAVVVLLLQGGDEVPRDMRVATQLDTWHLQFWQHTIVDVAKRIRRHVREARRRLDELENVDQTELAAWLDSLEASVALALKGRKEALQFMQAYEKP